MKISEVINNAKNSIGKSASDFGFNGEWCHQFVDWLTKENNPFTNLSYASCTRGMADWTLEGRVLTNKLDAKTGDLVYFQDLDDIYGDFDHVGIITGVDGNYITTIEGNTNGRNWMSTTVNTYSYHIDSHIIGSIVRPEYEDYEQVNAPVPNVLEKLIVSPHVYSVADVDKKLEQVSHIQSMLNHYFNYNYLDVDGYYGNNTKNAVILYQSQHNLTSDGIVGKNTMTELINDFYGINVKGE